MKKINKFIKNLFPTSTPSTVKPTLSLDEPVTFVVVPESVLNQVETEQSDSVNQTEQPDSVNQTEQSDLINQTEQSDSVNQTEQSDLVNQTEQPEPDLVNQSDLVNQTEQLQINPVNQTDSIKSDLVNQIEQSSDQTPDEPLSVTSNKKTKKNLTSYWGVSLSESILESNDTIAQLLILNPQLKPLKKIHSTLLFVGKKVDPTEEIFKDLVDKECTLTVDAVGYSENAMALSVRSITYDNDQPMPTYAVKQHITLALKAGTKAFESVKTLQGEGTVVDLDLILTGTVHRYLF